MSFYTRVKEMADRLLQQYGEQLTFTRVTEGAYDVSTGEVGSGSTINYSAYSHPYNYDASEIDDTNIQNNDVQLLIQKPTSYTPAVGDTVVLAGETMRLVSVERIRAQGSDAVYKAQLRV